MVITIVFFLSLGHCISLQVRECTSHYFNFEDFIRSWCWTWSFLFSL